MQMKMLPSAQFGRRLLLSGAGAVALSGCFGSFNATHALWDWNSDVSESKWVKWLVFLGLSIIPVYLLFVIADTLVLNSVEFWTGDNPVKRTADGRTVTRVATLDPDRVRLEVRRGGELELVAYCQRRADGALLILDADGHMLSMVNERVDGSLELHARNQGLIARLDPAAVRRVSAEVELGQPIHPLLRRELGDATWQLARNATFDAVGPTLL
jgi:hypothetical protein